MEPAPAKRQRVSTHSASPGEATSPSACPVPLDCGIGSQSSTSYLPVPTAEQATRMSSTSAGGTHLEPSAPSLHTCADEEPQVPAHQGCGNASCSACHMLGSAEQAAQTEIHMDSTELCSQPFEDLGPLVVTAPPWRPQHIFSRRSFVLVLRNPREPSRGLVLMSSTDMSVVSRTAHGILAELNAASPDFVAALSEPGVYDALNHDPALFAAVASSYDVGEAGAGLSQVLGSLSINSSALSALPTIEPTNDSAQQPEEAGECPICFEAIAPGEAAMRCAGEGGAHHYFHAHCLQHWIQSSQSGIGSRATCPMCRGRIQFNGQRLQEFLNNESSAGLCENERSFLQSISDGLQGRNDWADMTGIERAAHVGGIAAAAGLGFIVGFSGSHAAEQATIELMNVAQVPRQHQIAEGVGWGVGLLARVIRDSMRERGADSRRRRR